MKTLEETKKWLEWLGGSSDRPPSGGCRWHPWARGIWWGILAILIACFCGQSSRFLYVDF